MNAIEKNYCPYETDFEDAFTNVNCDGMNDIIDSAINEIRNKIKVSVTQHSISSNEMQENQITPENKDEISEPVHIISRTDSKKVTKTLTPIEKHFFNKGLVIANNSRLTDIDNIISLAKSMEKGYNCCPDFFTFLNAAASSPGKEFTFYLKNVKNAKSVISVAEKLSEYDLLSSYKHFNNHIRGIIPEIKKITSFIRGGWLELYCAVSVQEVLNKLTEKYDIKTDILMNVQLEKINSEGTFHELDIVFSVNDTVYAVEAKSGKLFNGYSRLYQTRSELGLIPDHCLLVQAAMTDTGKVEALRYFYEYYFANTESLKARLYEMIESGLNK